MLQSIIKKLNILQYVSDTDLSYGIKDFKLPIIITESILDKLKVLDNKDDEAWKNIYL